MRNMCSFFASKNAVCCLIAVFISPMFASENHVEANHLVRIVESGTAEAVVLIENDEEPDRNPVLRKYLHTSVDLVAGELIDTIQQISGTTLSLERIDVSDLQRTVLDLNQQGKVAVLLGDLALAQMQPLSASQQEALEDPSSFFIHVTKEWIAIGGATPRATEIGVHAFLEQLGMRWFFPGKLGTVVPSLDNIEIPIQNTLERPAFKARNYQLTLADDWIRHQRAGGPYFPGAHGIPLGDEITITSHPDYYALVDGKRVAAQLCLSHPDVLKLAIQQAKLYFKNKPYLPWYGVGPNDGGGFCECKGCLELDGDDWDPFSSSLSVTDRYVWFFNQMLKEIHQDFPGKKLAFYVYHAYMRPPVKVVPDSAIMISIAPIGLCRIHGMNNPICAERGYLKQIVREWTKLVPEVYERGYWFNLADPAMPFIQTHRLEDEISYYADVGIQGFRTECAGHWALQGPSLYAAGKLMWNPDLNTDEILSDYCRRLFGPAANAMQGYFHYLNDVIRDADYHTGSAFDILNIYPSSVRGKAQEFIDQALSVAPDGLYRDRVEMYATGFAYSNAFAEMIEARNEFDWELSYAALQQVDEYRERLRGYEVPMLGDSAIGHLRRFFRLPIEQGFARTTGGNRMIAPLSDVWEFLIDPHGIGEDLSYYNDQVQGSNWQQIATSTTSWSNEGLRYYKGLAWYRQEVKIEEAFVGKRVFLWFGGVDETARVWVNGTLAGISPVSAFTPFEVDVTELVREGINHVVICVANLKTDELGTGGIVAPAFFYLPAAGDKAQLENIRPLRQTFP